MPVDQGGQRLRDPAMNVLTVVTPEAYEDYVQALRGELREELGHAASSMPEAADAEPTRDQAPTAVGLPSGWLHLDVERMVCEVVRRFQLEGKSVRVAAGERIGHSVVESQLVEDVRRILADREPALVLRRSSIRRMVGELPEIGLASDAEGARRLARVIAATVADQTGHPFDAPA